MMAFVLFYHKTHKVEILSWTQRTSVGDLIK